MLSTCVVLEKYIEINNRRKIVLTTYITTCNIEYFFYGKIFLVFFFLAIIHRTGIASTQRALTVTQKLIETTATRHSDRYSDSS